MCMQEGDYMRAHLPPNSLGVNHQSLLASANFQAWPKRSHFCPLRLLNDGSLSVAVVFSAW